MTRKKEFLTKLQQLLTEYNASIDYEFSESADTHGLGSSGMAISMEGNAIAQFPYESRISAYDLKRCKK